MSLRDHVGHSTSSRPNGIFCHTCDVYCLDPQVIMPVPPPLYTDPEDMRRLRPVTSVRGWAPDRDDVDADKLRKLYADMDSMVRRFRDGTFSDEYAAAQMANLWDGIRQILKGE